MYNVSEKAKQLYKSGAKQVLRIRRKGISYNDALNTDYTFFTDGDIEKDSFIYQHNLYSTSNISLGSVCPATASFTLLTHCNGEKTLDWDSIGAISNYAKAYGYYIEVGIKDWNNVSEAVEWCSLGEFFSASVEKAENGKVKVTMYDRMTQLDKPCGTLWNGRLFKLGYDENYEDLAYQTFTDILCECFNVQELSQLPFSTVDYGNRVTYYPTNVTLKWQGITSTTTYRQLLSMYLIMLGQTAFFNDAGSLCTIGVFGSKDETHQETLNNTEMKSLIYEDFSIQYTSIKLQTKDDGVHTHTALVNDAGNINANILPLLQYAVGENTLSKTSAYDYVLQRMAETIIEDTNQSIVWTDEPFNSLSLGIPYMEVCDSLIFDNSPITDFRYQIHNITFCLNNYSKFASVGQPSLASNSVQQANRISDATLNSILS